MIGVGVTSAYLRSSRPERPSHTITLQPDAVTNERVALLYSPAAIGDVSVSPASASAGDSKMARRRAAVMICRCFGSSAIDVSWWWCGTCIASFCAHASERQSQMQTAPMMSAETTCE